jgi:hypothetical protein
MVGLNKSAVACLPGRHSTRRRLEALEDEATVTVGAGPNAIAILKPGLDASVPRKRHPPLLVDHGYAAAAELPVVLGRSETRT